MAKYEKLSISVDGAAIKCPSTFEWGLQDISASESGRTDDTLMHKNRVGQKRKIQLGWNGLKWDEASAIVSAFNPQYVSVTYPDILSGAYETRTFYVGDRSAPFKWWYTNKNIISTLSFNIIER